MDKNAIKKYAVWARRELISRVSQKALQYGIDEDNIVPGDATSVNGTVLSNEEIKQRKALIERINDKGYQQVMEEVAYTWFNRFSALRFMEVNGYLPSRVRVFTDEENNFKPQILAEAIHLELDGLDMEKVYEFKDNNNDDGLFKYLIITQCNALGAVMPRMFEKISDYTELLFPDNLLREGSVVQQMIEMIPEEDWKDAVQIIGWLYQYYNSEKKDEVFAALKKNVKITKENIPAATQLFTPDWIVRYMVENSLGRLWVEGHPDAKEQLLPTQEEQSAYVAGNRDDEDTKWHYYLEEAEQEADVQAQLAEIRKEYASITPEQIKCIDPCSGSGHILAYMFDVLMQIYENYGYTAREAVRSIIENNIYGLDIDDRAAQLAYFAVMMKARQYDRRFLTRKDENDNPDVPQPNVFAIVESNGIDGYTLEYFANGNPELKAAIDSIVKEMRDAKEYGSILTVTPQDWSGLYNRFAEITEDIHISREATLRELMPLVQVAEVLAQKYDAVVTNPPYMGASNMNPKLNDFIKRNYTDYKSDFFSAFVIHCSEMAKESGYCGFFTPYVWMFIQSYEKMRKYLYTQTTIETLIQFEYSAFEEATVPVCTFAFQNRHIKKKGGYIRLVDFRGGMEIQRQKTLEAIKNHECGFYYEKNSDEFSKIPGSPVAYWISDFLFRDYDKGTQLGNIYDVKKGMTTADNNRFLRFWFEVEESQLNKKWYKTHKGGEFRKWYGNDENVVNWQNNGSELKAFSGSVIRNEDYYFRRCITWNDISSSRTGFRYISGNSISNASGPSVYDDTKGLLYVLGLCNSKVVEYIFALTCPTIHFEVGRVAELPVLVDREEQVIDIVESCVSLSQEEWNSYETAWDFITHPLVRCKSFSPEDVSSDAKLHICDMNYISEAYVNWSNECYLRFNQLKANEEELNRIFIDIYGLQDELSAEVDDKDVTVRLADVNRDVKSLISYAVGCMLGRYSLDEEGLAFAGGEWDDSKYVSFHADKDNIIPICDDEYFEDDIVGRFVQFVKTVYGADTLEENLQFIADALGGKGQPKDVIRNYFMNDFYADHCKMYQKRPIYWLFDSGKKGGFRALVYMHRYQPDTIARMRTDYVHEQQSRYRTAIADLEQRIESASTSERVKLNRRLKTLNEQATEIQGYEEKIHHLADQYISIDLDDGVKKNYEIFKDVLAKIK